MALALPSPHVDQVYPDKTSPAGSRYAYTKSAILARAQSCLEDLYKRKDKFIAIVSHSGFLRLGVTGCWFYNGDYRVFDLEETKGPYDEYRLKQWELTYEKGGGMGWSWKDWVEIGSELPDDPTPIGIPGNHPVTAADVNEIGITSHSE